MATVGPRSSREPRNARWALRPFGCFAIFDRVLRTDATPRSRKARAALAYISSHAGTLIARERVSELLWGDSSEARARASLRQALMEIRHAANGDPPLLRSDREHLWVVRDHVEWDEGQFDEANGETELAAFADLDHVSREFDAWLAVERSHWVRERATTLRQMAADAIVRRDGKSAFSFIERMQVLDPFDEEAWRLAMIAEHTAGHSAAVELRFRQIQSMLREELGVEPSAETRQLHDELTQRGHAVERVARGALSVRSRPNENAAPHEGRGASSGRPA